MTRDEVLHQFDRLNVWSRGGQRAPHKPLLALLALGRWQRGETADVAFGQVAGPLTELLKEFGPPRQSYHPEYPFWRLQNDGVWAVHATGALKARQGNTDPPRSELLAHDARGGFSADVQAALRSDPTLAADAGAQAARKRDPQFRRRVLLVSDQAHGTEVFAPGYSLDFVIDFKAGSGILPNDR